jgi:hypothetical protein
VAQWSKETTPFGRQHPTLKPLPWKWSNQRKQSYPFSVTRTGYADGLGPWGGGVHPAAEGGVAGRGRPPQAGRPQGRP